jgi:hypothetical protein
MAALTSGPSPDQPSVGAGRGERLMKPRKSFPLRLSPELYQAIEAWAQQDMRSVNGQIEFLLREAVNKRRGLSAENASPPDYPADRNDE